MIEINGKEYPLWSQFIEDEGWTGGTLQDFDMGHTMETEIVDITLEPNGKESAFFSVNGKDFSCGFGVKYGGITAGEDGYITFIGFGGHSWRIKKRT